MPSCQAVAQVISAPRRLPLPVLEAVHACVQAARERGRAGGAGSHVHGVSRHEAQRGSGRCSRSSRAELQEAQPQTEQQHPGAAQPKALAELPLQKCIPLAAAGRPTLQQASTLQQPLTTPGVWLLTSGHLGNSRAQQKCAVLMSTQVTSTDAGLSWLACPTIDMLVWCSSRVCFLGALRYLKCHRMGAGDVDRFGPVLRGVPHHRHARGDHGHHHLPLLCSGHAAGRAHC